MEKTKEFYEKIHEDDFYEGGSNTADFKFKEVIKEIKRLGIKSTTVLDVGCSSGYFLKNYVVSKNKFGTDISKNAVQKARSNGIKADVIDIENQDIILNTKLDLIFCMDVLEHTFDPLSVLIKLKKCLCNEGYIIITLPNDVENIFKKVKLVFGYGVMLQYKNNGHIRFFNKRTICDLLSEAGFEVIKVRGYGRIPFNNLFSNTLSYGYIAIAKNNNK